MPDTPHDPLTGLPGRAEFHVALAAALTSPNAEIGILLVGIDDFGNVRKMLGHAVGDAVLKSIGERLAKEAGDAAMVARTGDTEFALLVPGIEANAHCADVAQFVARSTGRDRALSSKPSLRTQIERSVRDCIAMGNFSLHYQPIVTFAEPTRLDGLEGFLRWHHPTRGLIFAGDFRPVLEEPKAARMIGSAALTEAVHQLRRWTDTGVEVGRVSLNISAVQLREGDLADEVLALLAKRGVKPDRLALELPEDIYLEPDLAPIRVALERLRDVGVRLAVDGWAQGALDLDELKRLPIEELKLDRAFVQAVANADDLGRIIGAAHAAGVMVTAEGVETTEECERLRDLGCDRAQGWLIGRPMAAIKLPAFLQKLAITEPMLSASDARLAA